MRCLGIPELRFTGRAPAAEAAARAPPCSTRPPRWRRARPTRSLVYRAFNERSGRRFGQPIAEQRARPAAGLELVPAVRPRHAGQDVLALVPALHARVRRHQRGLRPLHGRRPRSTRRPTRTRGSTSGRSRSRTTRSRAGSSSRCCACSTAARRATVGSRSSSPAPTVPRDLPQPTGARSRPPPRRTCATATMMFNYYHDDLAAYPEARVPRPAALRAPRGLAPADIDVAMIYENFSPIVFLQLEAFGFCGPGEATRLHRRRQHRPRRRAAR